MDSPTKKLPTGLTPKEAALAHGGAMVAHGFELSTFALALACVHLGGAKLRQLANLVLLLALGFNGPCTPSTAH